ncbi:MAG: type VI secretion system lipoprotein TssJ [Thiotrichaceae bacterium]|nr:type VI secretion system lipoprotein TssJ [Thiotrichaceae bacterium]
MRFLPIFKFSLMSFALLSSAACTTMNSKVGEMLNLDTDLKLTFIVSANANLDDDKVASPLIINMYELTSPDMFEKGNFIDIFERDSEILGADLIDKHRLKHLQPGEKRLVRFVLDEKTRYVGLFAEFLMYKDAQYKLVIPIAQTNVFSSSAEIKISTNILAIIERDPPKPNVLK